MCLPNYRRGDGVFLLPSPDTEPPNTHTHTRTHARTHAHTHTLAHTHTHSHTHTHTHTHTHSHTHTHTHTHTPDIPAESEWQGWLSMWGCMWLVIMGFSPRRASHRRISTRKQCRKIQTHTDIPSGCTQDHWQAVTESVSIKVSLVAMNECLTWISHTTWWMSLMRLKNACFVYMLVHKLTVSYKSHIRQTNQTIRSAKARPNFSITGSEWSLNRSFL